MERNPEVRNLAVVMIALAGFSCVLGAIFRLNSMNIVDPAAVGLAFGGVFTMLIASVINPIINSFFNKKSSSYTD